MSKRESDALFKEFCISYKEWLDAGATSSKFNREFGLCTNYSLYLRRLMSYSNLEINNETDSLVIDRFNGNQFPFNESAGEYYIEVFNHECHRNQKRIDWVNAQIANIM